MIAVSNTSPLILLDKAKHLFVLGQLFKKVIIPDEVDKEWLRPGGYVVPKWLQIMSVPSEAQNKAKELCHAIDAGEAEAIALFSAIKANVLILDDLNGRRKAKALGFPVVGTVGILIRAKQKGIIPKLAPVLDTLKEYRFYIDDELLKYALTVAEET